MWKIYRVIDYSYGPFLQAAIVSRYQGVKLNTLERTRMLEAVRSTRCSNRECLRGPFSRSQPAVFFAVDHGWRADRISQLHEPGPRNNTAARNKPTN